MYTEAVSIHLIYIAHACTYFIIFFIYLLCYTQMDEKSKFLWNGTY